MAKNKGKTKAKRKLEAAEAAAGNEASPPKMARKDFERELAKLQVELTRLQAWTLAAGARIIVVFEGRDTAGKGGVISRITQRVSPRVFKHIALPTPSDREKTQIYSQRYIAHFPAGGEIILFDRSWYNRAGVERVMGFCTEEQSVRFLEVTPQFERELVDNGIILLKYFLDVSQDEQRRRFESRVTEPVKHWKLSPMDTEFGAALVGLHQGLPGYDPGDRHDLCALVHRSVRRPAPGAPQPDQPHAEQDPVQENRCRAAQAAEGGAAPQGC